MQKRVLLVVLVVALAGAVAAAALAAALTSATQSDGSPPVATSTGTGGSGPDTPTAYQPGDFVYTCDWIAAHPAAASAARVSCDPNIRP